MVRVGDGKDPSMGGSVHSRLYGRAGAIVGSRRLFGWLGVPVGSRVREGIHGI